MKQLNDSEYCFFDISVPNFNVFYEAGYAIGRGKVVIPLINVGLSNSGKYLNELGIFDTIGLANYSNSEELVGIFDNALPNKPIFVNIETLNSSQPLYVVDAYHRTEFASKVISAIKESKTHFRSFDPTENYRMAAHEVIREVSSSTSVLVTILNSSIEDHKYHNMRSAFVAGLADGMDKNLLILNYIGNDWPPLDIRDYVKDIKHPDDINIFVNEFGKQTLILNQRPTSYRKKKKQTIIEKLSIGSPAAENEFRDLHEYFVETYQFKRTLNGEVQVVAGRKGTGKTAIFWQVRDRLRLIKDNLVLDLKPEGYQLRKFKDQLVCMLSEGTKEHTISAFWEYLLYLELCHKIIESDKYLIGRNPALLPTYEKIRDHYEEDDIIKEGDFSERMSLILSNIGDRFRDKYGESTATILSNKDITELVYSHNFIALRKLVHQHLRLKEKVFVLFDNIDKGWEAEAISNDDILIVRTLIEALRKIERRIHKDQIAFHGVVFLRNDILEHLLNLTPDRGKEAIIQIDWSDRELLKDVIQERFIRAFDGELENFDSMWSQIACDTVEGVSSIEFILNNCLMRPRTLIELLDRCLSIAISKQHDKIEESDFLKGYETYSQDVLSGINLEVRQIFAGAYDAIYTLIGLNRRITTSVFYSELAKSDYPDKDFEKIVNIFLWFGIFGIVNNQGESQFIYDFNYGSKLMNKHRLKSKHSDILAINPAFYAALSN